MNGNLIRKFASLALALMLCAIAVCGMAETGIFTKVDDLLYEVTFDTYSAEAPDGSAYADVSGDMACSGVRNGSFVGRNFDYMMNSAPSFVIRTTAQEGRYATIGIGRMSGLTAEMVETGLPQEKLDLLPWALLDGMNEKGLVVNSNVLFKEDWGEIPHTGTHPDAPELNALFAIRALLDNCATADEAVAYLDAHNITPMGSQSFDMHFMISDPDITYVVEYINNEAVVKEQYVFTNYFINIDHIPEHPDGLERLRTLQENYDEGSTMEGMYRLMQRAKYSNMYDAAHKWYSEFNMTYPQIREAEAHAEELEAMISEMGEAYKAELEYVKENGYRESTEWWVTMHNSIYDINNRKLWVTVRERYDQKPFEFVLE